MQKNLRFFYKPYVDIEEDHDTHMKFDEPEEEVSTKLNLFG